MNVEIEAEAALFPEKEYIRGIFVAVHSIPFPSPFYWRILKKTMLFSAFINPYKKIPETRKFDSFHE
jgi:hypothetical protein